MRIRYVGGPLGGQETEDRSRRHWPYRRDDGTRLPAGQGDAIFMSGGGQRKRHGYVLTKIESVNGPERVYLHASVA